MDRGRLPSYHGDMKADIVDIEIASLKQPFRNMRVQRPEMVRRLSLSLEQHGQLSPVVVLAKRDGSRELLDGYRRVDALRRLGKDLVKAELWDCADSEALVRIMTRNQQRSWEAVEEAMLLRELRDGHHLSQHEIAQLLGKTQSWVARRLSLLDVLSEEILSLVIKGKVSSWSASRILAPMARAIPDHAASLCEALQAKALPCRALTLLWNHYQKANKGQRAQIVANPELFLKALKAKEEEKHDRLIREGPEGAWLHDVHIVTNILKRLRRGVFKALHCGQKTFDRRVLLTAFADLAENFRLLKETVGGLCHEQTAAGETGGNPGDVQTGDRDPQDQPPTEGVEGSGAAERSANGAAAHNSSSDVGDAAQGPVSGM